MIDSSKTRIKNYSLLFSTNKFNTFLFLITTLEDFEGHTQGFRKVSYSLRI